MKHDKFKTFNLKNERPQVLLFGNGFFYNICNWDNLINNMIPVENEQETELMKHIPYSIRANIALDTEDRTRRDKYCEQLCGMKPVPDERVKKLLEIPFNAIVTTNYTYELESCIEPKFAEYSEKTLAEKYVYSTRKAANKDSVYMIHTFNRVENFDIWHMHGEKRRKSSLILTHDEYGRLVNKILEYNAKNKNRYKENYADLHFKSWIDYLIMGDVYVLGFGADFSEFDFWWLLNRRLREKAKTGKVYFFDFQRENEREALWFALEKMEVEINPGLSPEEGDWYDSWYLKSMDKIRELVEKNKKSFSE